MRKYDYLCKVCKIEFELEHDIDDELEKRCPECWSTEVRKIIRASPLIFKGDGFTLSKR